MAIDNDITVDRGLCCHCGACVAICPKDAIFLDDIYIGISINHCSKCGLCIKECPLGAIDAGWFQ